MNRVLRYYSATVLLLTATAQLQASDVGKAGAQFLKIGTGSRAEAMAGAFAAVSGDLHDMHSNPGGLADLKKQEITTTYLRYFQGVDYGFVGYGRPTEKGVVGLGVTYLTLGGIEGRTADTVVADREFGATDMAVNLSLASKLEAVEGLSLGLTGRVVSMKLDNEKALTGAADLGLHYKSPWEGLDMGLVLKNMGPGVKFVDETDPLPMEVHFGLGYKPWGEKMLFTGDAIHGAVEKTLKGALGTEYRMKSMALRAGYRFGQDTQNLGVMTGFAAGLGISLYNAKIDYAFVPFGDLGDTHRFTFSLSF